jgi:hypothetical protein
VPSVVRTLRDARLWRLSLASGLYLYAQVAVIGFGVLFLHDKHSLADHDAALVIAVAQILAVGLRIGIGRYSDMGDEAVLARLAALDSRMLPEGSFCSSRSTASSWRRRRSTSMPSP